MRLGDRYMLDTSPGLAKVNLPRNKRIIEEDPRGSNRENPEPGQFKPGAVPTAG